MSLLGQSFVDPEKERTLMYKEGRRVKSNTAIARLWISNQQTVLLVINILSSLQQVLSNCIITALFLKQSPPLK